MRSPPLLSLDAFHDLVGFDQIDWSSRLKSKALHCCSSFVRFVRLRDPVASWPSNRWRGRLKDESLNPPATLDLLYVLGGEKEAGKV